MWCIFLTYIYSYYLPHGRGGCGGGRGGGGHWHWRLYQIGGGGSLPLEVVSDGGGAVTAIGGCTRLGGGGSLPLEVVSDGGGGVTARYDRMARILIIVIWIPFSLNFCDFDTLFAYRAFCAHPWFGYPFPPFFSRASGMASNGSDPPGVVGGGGWRKDQSAVKCTFLCLHAVSMSNQKRQFLFGNWLVFFVGLVLIMVMKNFCQCQ